MKLRNKIFFSFTALNIAVVLFAAWLISSILFYQAIDETKNALYVLDQVFQERVHNYFNKYEEKIKTLAEMQEFTSLFDDNYILKKIAVSAFPDTAEKVINHSANIKNILISDKNKILYSYKQERLAIDILNNSFLPENTDSKYLFITRNLLHKKDKYITIKLDLSELINSLDNIKINHTNSFFIFKNNKIIFSDINIKNKITIPGSPVYFESIVNDTNYLIYTSELNGYTYGAMIQKDELKKNNLKIIIIVFILSALIIIANITISFYISKAMTGSLMKLVSAANSIIKHDYIKVETNVKDETRILADVFNQMSEEINNFTNNLENMVELRTAEIEEKNKKLEILSTTDWLSKLYNRRYFNEKFETEFTFAYERSFNVSLMIMDIDFFKDVNDTYGHPAGDECIKVLGRLLKDRFKRDGEIAARYGGEEFIVFNLGEQLNDFINYCEELRNTIEKNIIEYNGQKIKFTVSMGITGGVPLKNDNHDEWLKKADDALYVAKSTGRNKIHIISD